MYTIRTSYLGVLEARFCEAGWFGGRAVQKNTPEKAPLQKIDT